MLGSLLLFLAGQAAAPIDASIFADRAAGERASFLVVFREQADLSGAMSMSDRGERRRFVYEALRARADASQAGLGPRLERDGVKFRRHFLVNMLEVEGDATTAEALSRERGVLALVPNRSSELRRVELPAGVPRSAAAIEPNIALVGAPEIWARGFT